MLILCLCSEATDPNAPTNALFISTLILTYRTFTNVRTIWETLLAR